MITHLAAHMAVIMQFLRSQELHDHLAEEG
jgi:hypothetical protein